MQQREDSVREITRMNKQIKEINDQVEVHNIEFQKILAADQQNIQTSKTLEHETLELRTQIEHLEKKNSRLSNQLSD